MCGQTLSWFHLREFLLKSESLVMLGCGRGHSLNWFYALKKKKTFAAFRRVCPVNEMLHFRVICCDL